MSGRTPSSPLGWIGYLARNGEDEEMADNYMV